MSTGRGTATKKQQRGEKNGKIHEGAGHNPIHSASLLLSAFLSTLPF